MTLRTWLVQNGYAISENDSKCHSPFGSDDNHPSAYMNPNHIYDFRSRSTFTLKHFYQKFGVTLDYDPSAVKPSCERAGFKEGEVLFTYKFKRG